MNTLHRNWMPGYATARAARRSIKQYDLTAAALGVRVAEQQYRDLKTLFTFHPGERCELDYTRYGVYLFPNRSWKEPVLFQVGIGVDHASGVIKGFTITHQPTAISGIRLYKNCVLPAPLWLPKTLAQKYGEKFDVCGFDRLVAIDNARDLQSDQVTDMFLAFGAIILCVPPKRGDLKGKVERTIQALEKVYFESLPGYVPDVYRFTDHRHKLLREKAKKEARLVQEEFFELVLLAVLAYNERPHPVYNKPRIQIYREGLQFAPPILPVGLTQIDTIFSKKRLAVVTREGVCIDNLQYNSEELAEFCRVGQTKAMVHVPVDDVRTAIVYHRELVEPLLVPLTTHPFTEPTPYEMATVILDGKAGSEHQDESDMGGNNAMIRYFNRAAELQSSPVRIKGAKAHLATSAAAQAGPMRPVEPPMPAPVADEELLALFGNPKDRA